jgi:hypothetical protein
MATGNGRTLLKIMQTDPKKRKQYLKELELKKQHGKQAKALKRRGDTYS